jgi:hypothetical protein
VEFILSPFLNYDFIFISLAFSRGGVGRRRKGRREAGKYVIVSRLLSCFVLFLGCLLSAK